MSLTVRVFFVFVAFVSVLSANLALADSVVSEKDKRLLGGATSYLQKADKNAFLQAAANMPFEKKLDFKVGHGLFKKLWVTAPTVTQVSDGLGPLYNARSCQSCHVRNGRGHAPEANWPEDNAISMLMRLSIPAQTVEQERLLAEHKITVVPEPTYGQQLQDFATIGHKAEGHIQIDRIEKKVVLAGGETVILLQPEYGVTDLGYGELHPQTLFSPRIAPPMIGLGLLEAIDEQDLLANADPEDTNQDGISGKINQVWSLNQRRLMPGRFGWKASVATLDEQNQNAFSGDIGISTPLLPDGAGECTDKQTVCKKARTGNSPQYGNVEAHQQVTDLVLYYTRHIAVPAQRLGNQNITEGEKLFHQLACASCHRPKYVTADLPQLPELSQQTIWPYTDLLLHDMGDALADFRPEGEANGREWKTPPLWGIGLTKAVNQKSGFLHDGRARNIQEAILWHGGEAKNSKNRYTQLDKKQRQQLLDFLTSL